MKNIFLLLVTFNLFSQNIDRSKNFKIINNITNKPVENVKIYVGDSIVTQSDSNGLFRLANKNAKITLRKNYFDDRIIDNVEVINNQIIFDSIFSYQLEEVIISKNKNFLDQVYSNFLNKYNYKSNYKFYNKTIRFYSDNTDFVKMDELFLNGFMLKKSNNAIMQVYDRYYDLKFYESIGLKGHFDKDSKSEILFYSNKVYCLPILIYFKDNFFNFLEIHDFFKNQKKYKFEINEDENCYSLKYVYKNPNNSFKFNIKIVIDKKSNNILSYNKTLIDSKKNVSKQKLVNTTEDQVFLFKKYSEEVILRINNEDEFEIVNESKDIEYDYINKDINIPFHYKYILESTMPFNYNIDEYVNFLTLIKSK